MHFDVSQINSVQTSQLNVKIHFNIIITSSHRFPQWFLRFMFFVQNFEYQILCFVARASRYVLVMKPT
jgi:hypothetical protein